MENSLKMMFYARTAKMNPDGLVPLYMRITIDGGRMEKAVRYIDPKTWVQKSEKLLGKSAAVEEINEYIVALKSKVYSIQTKFVQMDRQLTIKDFEREWSGEKEKIPTLLEVFRDHNEKVKQLVNMQYSDATRKKYETSLRHTEAFIKYKFKQKDVEPSKIKYQTIVDYSFWLKKVRKCNHNSTIKYLTNFKKIINICIKNELITKSPFTGYKMVQEESDRRYLTAEELRRISEKEFKILRIAQVRDMFLFSCYTGLAYADIKKLTNDDLETRENGETWIITKRQKTKNESRVPLLPPAVNVLSKYADDPECAAKKVLLPVLSNQKMNAYLKEIGDSCGVEKHLTTHIARHTFATTVTLNKGVPIETVSKMLGHKNLKETQRYAKVLDDKIGADMKKLASEFQEGPTKMAVVRKLYPG